MTGRMTPKSPVTWIASIEMNEAERAAWTAFLYRLRDGQITTGLTGETLATFNNTASPLYSIFADGYVE